MMGLTLKSVGVAERRILPHHLHGKRILIADDNASGRDLLRAILEQDGYAVIEAADGEEAISMMNDHHPDLAILDIHLPKCSGLEVLHALRSNPLHAETPIMALTASATPGDRERILEAGFTDHYTKPLAPSRLRQIVVELLDNASDNSLSPRQ